MATVKIPAEQRTLTDQAEVTAYLAKLGIDYERWPLAQRAAANAPRTQSWPLMHRRSSN